MAWNALPEADPGQWCCAAEFGRDALCNLLPFISHNASIAPALRMSLHDLTLCEFLPFNTDTLFSEN
jgi:hypothetical protein